MSPVTLNEAYRVLGLSGGATAAEVKAAYRRRVGEAHPDRGGSASEFIRIRAAYEILSAHLAQALGEDDVPVPDDLREVIDAIVRDFREHQRWAEARTIEYLNHLESSLTTYLRTASRAGLRDFSTRFRDSWNATLHALFSECNTRSDSILQRYEAWYTESTQAVFDDLYRKELRSFAWRRGFWEVFLVLGALAGALTVVIGWEGPWRRWVSVVVLVAALGLSFLGYWWRVRRGRKNRERVEPLSVVPFELPEGGQFPTEAAMRRGRRTTAALGLGGLFLGSAAAGGFVAPLAGAALGAALGGAFDRLLNPTGRMRESMQADLRHFLATARPQVTGYVLEAHEQLLDEVRGKIVADYQARVKSTVRLLTAGTAPERTASADGHPVAEG